ncbi:hypothetical protein GCM10027614_37010 [Micromonospora vulcania]
MTLRAELSRLRRVLGPELLDSRPYRLRGAIRADFTTVAERLDQGDPAGALDAYTGPLLPGSDAPGVTRLRRLIDGQLRAAVLVAADPALLAAWTATAAGTDDLVAWQALARALPVGAPRRPSRSRASTSSPGSTRYRAQRGCNVLETTVAVGTPAQRRRR